jgi:hypothetical protein
VASQFGEGANDTIGGGRQSTNGRGREGAELAKGDLGICLTFECVVSVSRICSGT